MAATQGGMKITMLAMHEGPAAIPDWKEISDISGI